MVEHSQGVGSDHETLHRPAGSAEICASLVQPGHWQIFRNGGVRVRCGVFEEVDVLYGQRRVAVIDLSE